MKFNKNLFLVNDNNMNPYVSKGDVIIFEPMQLGYRTPSDVYVVEYNGKQMVARINFFIKGEMALIFNGDKTKLLKFEEHERGRVVFIGHVIGRVLKSGEMIKGYSFYSNPLCYNKNMDLNF